MNDFQKSAVNLPARVEFDGQTYTFARPGPALLIQLESFARKRARQIWVRSGEDYPEAASFQDLFLAATADPARRVEGLVELCRGLLQANHRGLTRADVLALLVNRPGEVRAVLLEIMSPAEEGEEVSQEQAGVPMCRDAFVRQGVAFFGGPAEHWAAEWDRMAQGFSSTGDKNGR